MAVPRGRTYQLRIVMVRGAPVTRLTRCGREVGVRHLVVSPELCAGAGTAAEVSMVCSNDGYALYLTAVTLLKGRELSRAPLDQLGAISELVGCVESLPGPAAVLLAPICGVNAGEVLREASKAGVQVGHLLVSAGGKGWRVRPPYARIKKLGVRALPQEDLYDLRAGERRLGTACVPSQQHSEALAATFRKGYSGGHGGSIEESDGEDEFEATGDDKWLSDVGTLDMWCGYDEHFRGWTPLSLAD